MRSTLFIAFVAASLLVAIGCGSSSGGGTGGAGGANGTGGAANHGGAGGGQGGGGGAGAGSTDCNPACTGQTVCVGSGTQGGAIVLADGGVCPAGRHLEGNSCIQDLGYACQPIPAGCNGTVTCTCASSLCTSQQHCTMISAQEITCVLEAP